MISKNALKYINSLKLKKQRLREKKFVVEGLKNVKEVLDSDFSVDEVVITAEHIHEFQGYTPSIATVDQLVSVSSLKHNEQALAVVRMRETGESKDLNFTDHVIVLDRVGDPGNLGTLIRCLDWFGFRQVVCSKDCADLYNPKTISATMGSFTRVRSYYLDLFHFLESCPLKICGLYLEGDPIQKAEVNKVMAFVLGSESAGIRTDLEPFISQRVTIPGWGDAESLNVAMAGSILMYQLRISQA